MCAHLDHSCGGWAARVVGLDKAKCILHAQAPDEGRLRGQHAQVEAEAVLHVLRLPISVFFISNSENMIYKV